MMIDGKALSGKIKKDLKEKISKLKDKKPGLSFILVGFDEASQSYVKMKKKACSEIGFHSEVHQLDESISEKELLSLIHKCNKDSKIHGILVQQPLPSHIDTSKVTEAIDPKKDVDGFHPINIGKLLLGQKDGFFPCTPYGILKLLEEAKIETASKHVVILGRSNIVGKPLAALLMQKEHYGNATVTVAHSKTKDLKQLCKTADILIAAIGKPHFVTADMVKENAIVIDVGINRQKNKIVGDVDFESVSKKCAKITPVPGGVGPMTIAMLLQNTYESFLKLA